MRRLIPGLLLLGVLAMSGAACSDDTIDPTPTNPTPTTPGTTVTEPPFTGTLRPNGAATYPFTATAGGTITATLTTLAGTENIGLSIGTWTGSACQVVIANDNAAQAAAISGTVTAAASLCVRVYDPGRLTGAADFNVTIVHP
jgi:hypothetical protein